MLWIHSVTDLILSEYKQTRENKHMKLSQKQNSPEVPSPAG